MPWAAPVEVEAAPAPRHGLADAADGDRIAGRAVRCLHRDVLDRPLDQAVEPRATEDANVGTVVRLQQRRQIHAATGGAWTARASDSS